MDISTLLEEKDSLHVRVKCEACQAAGLFCCDHRHRMNKFANVWSGSFLCGYPDLEGGVEKKKF